MPFKHSETFPAIPGGTKWLIWAIPGRLRLTPLDNPRTIVLTVTGNFRNAARSRPVSPLRAGKEGRCHIPALIVRAALPELSADSQDKRSVLTGTAQSPEAVDEALQGAL